MDQRDPEAATQQEVREDAAREEDDPVTSREELEVDLMEQSASEAGEDIGQPTP
ncbi:MAG: hypothetical protein M3Q48_05575 [Actinomycetota bacterium]|jgi:hypothetical protein|nr:hypothetical protein [Actinomycetota bacterium]